MTQPPPEGGPADRRVRGVFPGGPSGPGGSATPRATRPVRSMDDLQRAAARTWTRTARRRRGMRRVWVVAVMAALAAALGAGFGFLSHRSPSHALSPSQVQNDVDRLVQREVNRMLLELWKMESVEGMRGRVR